VVGVLRAPWPFGLGIRVWVTSGKKRVVGVLRAPWPFGLGIRVWVTSGKKRVVGVLRAPWPFGLGIIKGGFERFKFMFIHTTLYLAHVHLIDP
jgi:hypothetical protein